MPEKYKIAPPINCVTCNVKIKPLDPECNAPYDMIKGGVVGIMYAPFGSENDGYVFQIGVCDKCIDDHLETGRMKLIGDYMDGNIDKQIKEDLKKGDSVRR